MGRRSSRETREEGERERERERELEGGGGWERVVCTVEASHRVFLKKAY